MAFQALLGACSVHMRLSVLARHLLTENVKQLAVGRARTPSTPRHYHAPKSRNALLCTMLDLGVSAWVREGRPVLPPAIEIAPCFCVLISP